MLTMFVTLILDLLLYFSNMSFLFPILCIFLYLMSVFAMYIVKV